MSNAITLTIPADDKEAQRAAFAFFNALTNCGGTVSASAPKPDPEPANLGDDAPEPVEEQPKSDPQEPKDDTPTSADEYPIEVNGVSVDVDGRTWDHEIDSSNKKCYKSGSDAGRWMKRKGVDDNVRAEKVAQLIKLAKGEHVQNEQPQNAFNAGQAFGGGGQAQQQQQQWQGNPQQAQQTQGFQPSEQAQAVSDPQTFWQFIGTRNFNPDVQSAVCSSFGLSNLSQAVAAMANDKDILGKVAVELERVESQGA